MIIDIHGHVSAPQGLYAWKANQLASRGAHGRSPLKFTDEQLENALRGAPGVFGRAHLDQLDKHGTDLQLISPRPFQLMHSERPAKIVQWWHEEFHNVIAENVRLHPDRFVGIAALPIVAGDPVKNALPELERCVKMGFKGCIFNPDPYEAAAEPPPLDDRYWYPFYEKLCELDIPAMIHSASSKVERVNYSTNFIQQETIAVVTYCQSKVLEDFPNLKIIIPHGGGAVPYQIGRYQAATWARPKGERFLDRMRKLYYDCVLYSPEAVEYLIKIIGADRVMFGTECPGTGSHLNPETNRACDDVRPSVEQIEWLSASDKKLIFEDTAKKVFKLKV